MRLLVHESCDYQKAAKNQVQTKKLCSITQIRNLFLRFSTAVISQTRVPAATSDGGIDYSSLNGPPTEDDDVPTALQPQGVNGTSEHVATAVLKEGMPETVNVEAIEPVPLPHNALSRPHRVHFFYNEEDYGNEENKSLIRQDTFNAVRWWSFSVGYCD